MLHKIDMNIFEIVKKFLRDFVWVRDKGFFTGILNSWRQSFWKFFYNLASRHGAKSDEWSCINYGFIPDDGKLLALESSSKKEKCGNTSIQLYHEVANAVPIEGMNIVEVGCGRGGGAAYVAQYLKPKTMTAIDLSTESISFANNTHKPKCPNLHFQTGDALNLPLPADSYDVVLNVESSHCYPDFAQFMREVYRILKPGGHFVMCDLGATKYFPGMEKQMEIVGFSVIVNKDITKNVIDSMKLNSASREQLMRELVSPWWYNNFKFFFVNFAGLEGSNQFNNLVSGEYRYKRYVLQKPTLQGK